MTAELASLVASLVLHGDVCLFVFVLFSFQLSSLAETHALVLQFGPSMLPSQASNADILHGSRDTAPWLIHTYRQECGGLFLSEKGIEIQGFLKRSVTMQTVKMRKWLSLLSPWAPESFLPSLCLYGRFFSWKTHSSKPRIH